MSLTFQCPHCSTPATDGWELLDENVVHEMRCQYCQKTFFMRFFECQKCAEDNVTTSATEMDIQPQACSKCGYLPEQPDGSGDVY
ncbi:hypothetical protein [Burkholderia ambifaria]|uniref:hypothetical protein n=1 Tax=Burkholderia ambifaria TaxID=152480 RepID=UPI000F812480|nr:hypothetical protein [Burkholderia ambifaria]